MKQLNDLVSEADEIVKVPSTFEWHFCFCKLHFWQDKEREVVNLKELVDKDKMLIKVWSMFITHFICMILRVKL